MMVKWMNWKVIITSIEKRQQRIYSSQDINKQVT